MGHDSASWMVAQTKLTITNRQGEHEPQACEQSGNLEPATWSVSAFLCFTNGLLNPFGECLVGWWCPWSACKKK